jgi:hypothetical protein
LLLAADGVANEQIARSCGVDSDTVRRWRARFAETGIDRLGVVAKGRGRKPWLPEGTVAEVLRLTAHETPPGGATHWSTRTMAARAGIGKDKVAQIWADHDLKPWKVDTFKVSNDPHFEEKLVDVVGLYLNPPSRAVVFSFDEKTQCQALDRTQPSLPMKPGRAGTMTHDYKRNGTIDLFAAMNITTGQVLTDFQRRHAATDVLRFFKQIDAAVPRGAGCPRHPGQPVSTLRPRDHQMAGAPRPSSLAPAFHPDLKLLGQSRRTLVQRTHRQTAPLRPVHQRCGPDHSDHYLGRPLEHQPRTLHLESHRRRHNRQSPTRPPSTQPDQINDGPLVLSI